jgi:hypothetical protein
MALAKPTRSDHLPVPVHCRCLEPHFDAHLGCEWPVASPWVEHFEDLQKIYRTTAHKQRLNEGKLSLKLLPYCCLLSFISEPLPLSKRYLLPRGSWRYQYVTLLQPPGMPV